MPGERHHSVLLARQGWVLGLILLGSAAAGRLAAQDVVMAGRAHGVKVPNAYYAAKARNPKAFEFQHAWFRVAEAVRQARAQAAARMDITGLNGAFPNGRAAPAAAIAQRVAVSGTRRIPVLLAMFKNSDSNTVVAIGDSGTYRAKLFGTNPAPPYSVTTYYNEISNGLLTLTGSVYGWIRADSNDTYYEGQTGCNGLDEGCGAHTGTYLRDILAKADAQVDFSQFDNDGPDGIPNSGDDDGIVDFVAFIQPQLGGECGTNNLWSHRYVLEGWTPGTGFVTNDPAAGGGNIKVSDYILQSGLGGNAGCTAGQIMPIGTVAHESGHAFGLPDLYDVSQVSEGIGQWGLMGAGNWNIPSSPAHMEAWSKFTLGWIAVDTITGGGSRPYRLNHIVRPSVPAADTALALCTFAASCFDHEYFLLENRQAIGSDVAVAGGGGLLAWHVDPALISARLVDNSVNALQPHALALLEADGLNELDLTVGDRGDGGDPFPGSTANHQLGRLTNPSTALNSGFPSGIVVDTIAEQSDSTIAFNVRFETVAALPTQIALVTPPAGAVSGRPPTQEPVIELRDASDQPVHVAGIPVDVAIATGPGTLWATRGRVQRGVKSAKIGGGPRRSFGAGTVLTDSLGRATFSDLVLIDAGDYTLTFSVAGLPPVTTPTFTVTQPASIPLTNGQVVNVSDQAGRTRYYSLTVPAGPTSLIIQTSGGTGDVDLEVRQGAVPTTLVDDCGSFSSTTSEQCVFDNPSAGTYEVMLIGFETYANVTLTATYSSFTQLAVITQPGGAVSGLTMAQNPVVELRDASNQPVKQAGVTVIAVIDSGPGALHGTQRPAPGLGKAAGKKTWGRSGPARVWGEGDVVTDTLGRATFSTLSLIDAGNYALTFAAGAASVNSQSFTVTQPASTAITSGQTLSLSDLAGHAKYYSITLPSGADSLNVTTTGGTGDVDLFLRHTSPPTLSAYDCVSASFTQEEHCQVLSPQSGTWQIMLVAYADYANVSLTAFFPTVSYALTVQGAGPGTGTVTSSPGGISCTVTAGAVSGTCSTPVVGATPVTLTAAPNNASLFSQWTNAGACLHALACDLTVNQATSLTARFILTPDNTASSAPLLGGAALDAETVAALDQLGNKNGGYDLGDLLALIDHSGTGFNVATARPPLLRPSSRPSHALTGGNR
jgi:M6 family metalloprotease-like protein